MNSVIKISVDGIYFDICSKDTPVNVIDRIAFDLRSRDVENNIEKYVNDYLEDEPEDCGYRYIFNESSLIEFVVKMIELTENSKERIRKESVDMFEEAKEKISKYSEVLK